MNPRDKSRYTSIREQGQRLIVPPAGHGTSTAHPSDQPLASFRPANNSHGSLKSLQKQAIDPTPDHSHQDEQRRYQLNEQRLRQQRQVQQATQTRPQLQQPINYTPQQIFAQKNAIRQEQYRRLELQKRHQQSQAAVEQAQQSLQQLNQQNELSHNPFQQTQAQPKPGQASVTERPGSPYNRVHQPTSNTTKLQNVISRDARDAASRIAARQAEEAAIAESQRRYHTAWQQYYQHYYESYYIAALQQQYEKFAKQQAAVADKHEADGELSQTDAQQKLTDDLLNKIANKARVIKNKRWFWPIASAIIVIVVTLFIQFNSVIAAQIASFISPGDAEGQTIIVGTGENQPVSDGPRVIIPKINVNAPVTYGLSDLSEASSQKALQNGPINYPLNGANATPGQKGNTVILGHSSADVFAPGNYKFIFVQLNRLAVGDLFYLDYGGKRYTYKVSQTKVINPNQIDQLNLGTDKPYATLVTCDPPGTVARRLLIIGEQISPDPSGATASENTNTAVKTSTTITGKPKTLFEQIFGK